MKYVVLIFLLSCVFTRSKSIDGYVYALDNLVIDFKNGVSDRAEFETLYKRFEHLEEEIKDYYEASKSEEAKKLYQQSEALTALVGELSPDRRNFNLTMEKYDLAASILGLTIYEHPALNNATYCLPIAHLFLWDERYQALILVNHSQTLANYAAKVLRVEQDAIDEAMESSSKGGVDCYSMRGIEGYFTTSKGVLQCMSLECETTPYCLTK